MDTERPVDDLLRSASRELDRAAAAVAGGAPPAAELGGVRRRAVQRRRVGVAAAVLALVAGAAVVAWRVSPPDAPSLIFDAPAGDEGAEDGEAPESAADPDADPGPGDADAGVGQAGPGADDDSGTEVREVIRLPAEGWQVPTALASDPAGRFVVVGVTVDDADAGAARPAVWVGEDGSWLRAGGQVAESGAEAGEAAVHMTGVASDPDGSFAAVGFTDTVAAGTRPLAWRSDNGERWDSATLPDEAGSAEAVTWTGEAFVAVGAAERGSAVWTSPDGRAWSAVTFAGERGLAAEGILVDVLEYGGRLVLIEQVGDSSRLLAAEPAERGAAWQLREIDSFAGSLARLTGDQETGTLYAAGSQRPDGLGSEPLLLTSGDGQSWDREAIGWDGADHHDAGLHDAAVAGRVLVVAGTADGLPRLWARDPTGDARAAELPEGAGAPPLLAPATDGVLVVGTVEDGAEAHFGVWHWELPDRTGR